MTTKAIAAVSLLWVLALPVHAASKGSAQEGLAAPKFTARLLKGSTVQLDKLRTPAGAVVAFADPKAQDGSRTLAFFEQSQAELVKQGVGLVVFLLGVSQEATAQTMVKENGLTAPLAVDPGNKTARQYGVSTSAAVIVIDHNGTVVKRLDSTGQTGDIGPPALAAVREMLKAEAAEQPAAPAAGPKPDKSTDVPAATAAEGKAPRAKPSDDETRLRIANGYRLIQTGYIGSALEDARTLAEQRGDDFLATLWLAYCLEASQLFPEAAVTYRRVLLLKPGHLYSLKAVARIDPEGRYKLPADVPKPPAAPPATAAAKPGDKPAKPGDKPAATSSQGPATVGE